MLFEETIVALSTPPGRGAISIIRITGIKSIEIADRIFIGKQRLIEAKSHTVHFGKIIDSDCHETIDTVLVSVLKTPNSYTGFDTVEINCHGGSINTEMIIEVILKNGARLAEPGELTKLAFLNGKIDLTQVEAVADIIHSKTRRAHRSSVSQYLGGLSNHIKEIKTRLLNIASLIEMDVDFADEQLLDINRSNLIGEIQISIESIKSLLSTYTHGHLLRDGAKIAITGKPNVGKSSLMNSLLNKNRAIVSEIPGTTRDYLEESIDINGIPFNLIDTAGLRCTENPVEKTGIDKTKEQIETADLVLLMVDASNQLDQNDNKAIEIISEYHKTEIEKKIIIVKNKIDIQNVIEDNFFTTLGCEEVSISAEKMIGLDELKDLIQKLFSDNVSPDSPHISNIRQKVSLENCVASLEHSLNGLNNDISFEFIALDIRNALDCTREILGEISNDDILNNIFKNFCIGK